MLKKEDYIMQDEMLLEENNCEKIKTRSEKRKLSLRHKARFNKVAKKTKKHGIKTFSVRKNKNKRTKKIEKQSSKKTRRMVKMQLKTINLKAPEYDNIYKTFEMYEKQATPNHMFG